MDGTHDVLVVTLPPTEGGVPAKTKILCHHLSQLGHRVSVAWYATLSENPEICVPSWRSLSTASPRIIEREVFGRFPGYAVGCRFPELEAPYYQLSPLWKQLIARHDRFIAVGGQPLVANILAHAKVPHFLWCASDMMSDRHDRQVRMPWPRRFVDAIITRPWLRTQQAFVLAHTPLILGVSGFTLDRLRQNGGNNARLSRLPIPVDPRRYSPPPTPPTAPLIGFAGRFEDPRKNLKLLLKAFAQLRSDHPDARLRLTGSQPSMTTLRHVDRLGLTAHVDFLGCLDNDQLPNFFRSLSVFALPSWQEGLCLAGLEAMACGVPVVSTNCGGPADYVRDGESGFLVRDWSSLSFANALKQALAQRDHLSDQALSLVHREYSPAAFAQGIATAWNQVWGGRP